MTLESVYALGLSPAELQERVMRAGRQRARRRRGPAVPRATWTPRRTGCSTCTRCARRPARRCYLKLEPQFVATTMHAELPTMANLGGQWDGYLDGQDLTGLDRDRVRRLGHDYIERAIEAAGDPDEGRSCC